MLKIQVWRIMSLMLCFRCEFTTLFLMDSLNKRTFFYSRVPAPIGSPNSEVFVKHIKTSVFHIVHSYVI